MAKADRIDFTGTDSEIRQRSKRVPEGEYVMKVVDHQKKWRDDDRSNPPYYNWRFQIVSNGDGSKKHAGTPMYFITSLKPDALFNLRNLIFAATGKNVAGKSIAFDPASIYNKRILALVEDDEYKSNANQSTIRSKVVDVRPLSDLEESDDTDDEDDDMEEADEDDEPVAVKKPKKPKPPKYPKAKKKAPVEDDDEDLDEVDVDEI